MTRAGTFIDPPLLHTFLSRFEPLSCSRASFNAYDQFSAHASQEALIIKQIPAVTLYLEPS